MDKSSGRGEGPERRCWHCTSPVLHRLEAEWCALFRCFAAWTAAARVCRVQQWKLTLNRACHWRNPSTAVLMRKAISCYMHCLWLFAMDDGGRQQRCLLAGGAQTPPRLIKRSAPKITRTKKFQLTSLRLDFNLTSLSKRCSLKSKASAGVGVLSNCSNRYIYIRNTTVAIFWMMPRFASAFRWWISAHQYSFQYCFQIKCKHHV